MSFIRENKSKVYEFLKCIEINMKIACISSRIIDFDLTKSYNAAPSKCHTYVWTKNRISLSSPFREAFTLLGV